MPLLIRRRPRVDDSHLPATLHPLLRQIFASRGVEDPALLERSANQLLPPQRLFGMAQAVPLLAEALTAQNAFSSSVTLTATAPPVRRCACWPCAPWAVATSIFWCPTASSSVMASPRIVELAVARGAEFLITVDNGISSIAGVAAAKAAKHAGTGYRSPFARPGAA